MVSKQEIEYKKTYTAIFSMNYLFQGFTTSMFTVIIPIYLLMLITETGASITATDISFLAAIVLAPTAIKLLYGMLSDRFGLKDFGRRRVWIVIPIAIAGFMWILLPFAVGAGNILLTFTIIGVIINTGVMMADTALDGLILDICPKERLGRVQGTVWGFRSIGMIGGGPVLAFLVVANVFTQIESTFVLLGILMIASAILTIWISEPTEFTDVNIFDNVKDLFKKKKDIKTYFFALLNNVSDAVIMLFLSLYILLQIGIIESQNMSLSLTSTQGNNIAFQYQAIISIIVSIGVILGAIFGGWLTDTISRKKGVYYSMLFTAVSLFLVLVSSNEIILYLIAFIVGIGVGWRHTSYSAVASQMAKYHPEIDSTYFAFCNSLSNLGSTMGLLLMGELFAQTGSYILVFVVIGLAQLLNLIPFSMMDSDLYEVNLKPEEDIIIKTEI